MKGISIIKKSLFFIVITIAFLSCKPTMYVGSIGQVNQTQVVLSNSNFKVLGSYSATVTSKNNKIRIKGMEGLFAEAKAKLLAQAKSEGILLTGSRALVNVTTDVIKNTRRVTITISAEIIEFTK